MERRFLKQVNAQKLQGAGQCKLLVEDGHHQVNRHGDPDLGLHGVGSGPATPHRSVRPTVRAFFDPPDRGFGKDCSGRGSWPETVPRTAPNFKWVTSTSMRKSYANHTQVAVSKTPTVLQPATRECGYIPTPLPQNVRQSGASAVDKSNRYLKIH